MTETHPSLPWKCVALIAAAMAFLYCLGYGLRVAGRHTVEHNGGNTAPYPVFLSKGLVTALSIVAMNATLRAAGGFRQRVVSE